MIRSLKMFLYAQRELHKSILDFLENMLESLVGIKTVFNPEEEYICLRIPVEVCMSSNVICSSVPSYEKHHTGLLHNKV